MLLVLNKTAHLISFIFFTYNISPANPAIGKFIISHIIFIQYATGKRLTPFYFPEQQERVKIKSQDARGLEEI